MKNIRLNESQQQLVAEHIHLVDTVLYFDFKRIVNNPDHDYDDLYQTGCIGLCKAAAGFESGSFPAYARKCIRNALRDYSKKVQPHGKVQSLNAMTEDILAKLIDEDAFIEEAAIAQLLLSRVQEIKNDYSGITEKGITAIELKLKGLSGAEIAKMYGVEPNHVSAWIARAKKKLLADSRFLQAIA